MSSNNKTPVLGLNSWAGSDRPKREDFNYDNEVIDTVLGGHMNDAAAHLTGEERDKLNAPFVVGYYIGNDVNTRVFELEFAPSLLIIFSNSVPLSTYDKDTDRVFAYGGFATPLYATTGIYVNGNTFTVTESTSTPVLDKCYPRLNRSNYRYHYIAFK